MHGPVVHLETADERGPCLPGCGVRARRMKELGDDPAAGSAGCRASYELRWRKRRWFCDEGHVRGRTFTEQVAQIPARARLTTRLRRAAGAAVADGGRTVVQSARDHGVSWPVVSAAFTDHALRCCPPSPSRSPCWASTRSAGAVPRWVLDERPAVVGDGLWIAGMSGSWTCRGGQGCSARSRAAPTPAVIGWLDERGPAWKQQVAVVAIDMCTIFKSAIGQPCRTRRWSSTISTWCSWPTRRSPRSAAG